MVDTCLMKTKLKLQTITTAAATLVEKLRQ
jgi:hypothetical protein